MEASVNFGKYSPSVIEELDFDIDFSLDSSQNTVVPLGILDFNNNYENPYFAFNYSLLKSPVELLHFQITDESGKPIYNMGYLETIIVTAPKKAKILQEAKSKTPLLNLENPIKSWKYQDVFKAHILTQPDFTQPGSYTIYWDGFDNNETFDSKNFDNKRLIAKITAVKGGFQKSIEIDFTTTYNEVKWVDVKINKKTKKIDVELRVNLKDGGAEGFGTENYHEPLDDPRMPSRRRHPADGIPKEYKDRMGFPPIMSPTRNYQQLKQLAIEGLNYHWGRNSNHFIAKNVLIAEEPYEINVNAVNIDDDVKAIDDISLVYNTNGSWMRSGNPGTVEGIISAVGNLVSREAICYNVGYLKYSNGWGYRRESQEDLEFKDTVAHEIGHTVLKAYGGTTYSYGHKGSVYVVTQKKKSSAPKLPLSGEIDLMPYFRENELGSEGNQANYYARRVAAEKDVLSLLWLTKIKIR